MTIPRGTLWAPEDLDGALLALARVADLTVTEGALPDLPTRAEDRESWLAITASQLGIEITVVSVWVPSAAAELLRVGPALVPITDPIAGPGYLAVLGHRRHRGLRVLGADLTLRVVPVDEIAATLTAPVRATANEAAQHWLVEAPLSEAARARARFFLSDVSVDLLSRAADAAERVRVQIAQPLAVRAWRREEGVGGRRRAKIKSNSPTHKGGE